MPSLIKSYYKHYLTSLKYRNLRHVKTHMTSSANLTGINCLEHLLILQIFVKRFHVCHGLCLGYSSKHHSYTPCLCGSYLENIDIEPMVQVF